MAAIKYSRQRESIKECLKRSSSHPTADAVYMEVRKTWPNISLGTVYRNLNLLAELGEAIKISTPGGADHFDGRTDLHYHVICQTCGNVYDLELPTEHIEEITELANHHFDGAVTSHKTIFYGCCADCLKKKREAE